MCLRLLFCGMDARLLSWAPLPQILVGRPEPAWFFVQVAPEAGAQQAPKVVRALTAHFQSEARLSQSMVLLIPSRVRILWVCLRALVLWGEFLCGLCGGKTTSQSANRVPFHHPSGQGEAPLYRELPGTETNWCLPYVDRVLILTRSSQRPSFCTTPVADGGVHSRSSVCRK